MYFQNMHDHNNITILERICLTNCMRMKRKLQQAQNVNIHTMSSPILIRNASINIKLTKIIKTLGGTYILKATLVARNQTNKLANY
jgi:hypothetical protein